MDEALRDNQEGSAAMATDTRGEVLALKIICGFLLAELAARSEDPEHALGVITAAMSGQAAHIASLDPNDEMSQYITETMEQVTGWAEELWPKLQAAARARP